MEIAIVWGTFMVLIRVTIILQFDTIRSAIYFITAVPPSIYSFIVTHKPYHLSVTLNELLSTFNSSSSLNLLLYRHTMTHKPYHLSVSLNELLSTSNSSSSLNLLLYRHTAGDSQTLLLISITK